jgi:hypothetical protein
MLVQHNGVLLSLACNQVVKGPGNLHVVKMSGCKTSNNVTTTTTGKAVQRERPVRVLSNNSVEPLGFYTIVVVTLNNIL